MKTLDKIIISAIALVMTACSAYTLVDSQIYNNANLRDYSTFRIYYPTDGSDLPPGMTMLTYYNIAAAVREQMIERGYTESPMSPLVINLALTVKKELATAPLSAVLPPPTPPAPPIIVPNPAPAPPQRPTPPPAPGSGGPSASDTPQPQPQATPQVTSSRPNHFYVPPTMRPIPPAQPYFMYPRMNYWNYPAYYNTQVVTGIYREGVLTMDMFDSRTKIPLFSASVATILSNGDSQFRNLKGIAEAVGTLFSKFPVAVEPQYRKN